MADSDKSLQLCIDVSKTGTGGTDASADLKKATDESERYQRAIEAMVMALSVVPSVTRTLTLSASTNMVEIAWDAKPDASVAGYRIYEGTNSRNYVKMFDVGNVTNCIVPVFDGVNYFAATAYDGAGTESDFSNEGVWTNRPTLLYIQ